MEAETGRPKTAKAAAKATRKVDESISMTQRYRKEAFFL
jgi:hypothetical protein